MIINIGAVELIQPQYLFMMKSLNYRQDFTVSRVVDFSYLAKSAVASEKVGLFSLSLFLRCVEQFFVNARL